MKGYHYDLGIIVVRWLQPVLKELSHSKEEFVSLRGAQSYLLAILASVIGVSSRDGGENLLGPEDGGL